MTLLKLPKLTIDSKGVHFGGSHILWKDFVSYGSNRDAPFANLIQIQVNGQIIFATTDEAEGERIIYAISKGYADSTVKPLPL